MAGGHFEAHLDVSALTKILAKMGAEAADLSPVMAEIGEMLVAAVNDEFETAGRGRWPGYSPNTRRRRGSMDHAQMLKDTGALAASIHSEHGPDFAAAGTDKFYAIFHVLGAPAANIPVRNFLDIEESVYEDAVMMILQSIAK